MSLLASPILV